MALWGGRFSQGPDESVAALSRSVHFDWRLAAYDVRVNLAHLNGLLEIGVLTESDGATIKAGLIDLATDITSGAFTYSDDDEDVHSAIERGLTEKIGSLGGSIRAGRSRNDLVVTDFKLYLIDHLLEVAQLLSSLISAIAHQAEENVDAVAPGFTHLQHAQPINFGHELAKQAAAMSPVDVDNENVTQEVIYREIEIGKFMARQEGKPDEMVEKIVQGKLQNFFKEMTLLNQDFIKDAKKTVRQYIAENDKDLAVTGFKRLQLGA